MRPDFYIKVLFSIMLGMMAIPFLVAGLRGLKTQRTFLISSRWPLSMMLVFCIPLPLLPFLFLFSQPITLTSLSPLLLSAYGLLMTVCILLIVCYTMKGYMALGVTYTPLCEGLLATLEKLQLPYEESLSLRRLRPVLPKRLIRLTSVEADLQVSMWMGTVHLKVKQNQHYPLLTEIANAMNGYFCTSSVCTNMIPFAFYLITGGFMVILAIGALFFSSIL